MAQFTTLRFALAGCLLVAQLAPWRVLAQQTPSQQQPKTPPAQSPDPQDVVRINTQLVQVDAVITDKKGQHVPDLTQDDFELLVDGKPQALTHFSYINLPGRVARELPKRKNKDAVAVSEAMPTRELAPSEVRRTIAFVVDDLGLSFSSAERTRETLRKFIAEQMQPNDLVAIIRTGTGLGLLEQFTSDKRILYAAIEKLAWNPLSREMNPSFGDGSAELTDEQADQQANIAQFEALRTTNFTTGTLGAINFVVQGLRTLPGRKSVILLSDGFKVYNTDDDNQTNQVIRAMESLVEEASRSSVVIYAIDAKGLQPFMPGGETGGKWRPSAITDAQQTAQEALQGPVFLANQTGGFVVVNSNDLNIGVQEALYDQQSYYLLGFDPDDQNFDQKFHKIKIKVNRPGITVRTRSGFYGAAEEAKPEVPTTRGGQLLHALLSPVGQRELSLRMTPYFFHSAKLGTLVRALFHIDANKLTFSDAPDGKKQIKLDLAAFAFDETGATVDLSANVISLSFTPAQYEQVMANGLSYRRDFALKRAGAYQFRAVLRDDSSGRTGSASQFIRIPDLNKKQLALSGLVLTAPKVVATTAADTNAKINASAASTAVPAANVTGSLAVTPGNSSPPPPTGTPDSPYVRTFPASGWLQYGMAIYNAQVDKKTNEPQLSLQVEIYQDGKAIRQLPVHPLQVPVSANPAHFDYVSRLQFKDFPPGEYLLRVVVTDKLAKKTFARAEQWMDFRVR